MLGKGSRRARGAAFTDLAKRESLLAVALGLAAGPVFLAAGPDRFLVWYGILAAAPLFIPPPCSARQSLGAALRACLTWTITAASASLVSLGATIIARALG